MTASPWLRAIGGYVGGEWVQAASGATMPVRDPATGEILADVPDMGETDAEAAVQAAAEMLHATPSLATRESWLTAIADRLEAEADALGAIITREQGKPLREGEAEVRYAAGFYRYAAEHVAELAPRALPERERGCRWIVYSRPAGVVGLITPWNFPLAMHAKKFSAALAAGCPSISKPDEHTPLSLIAFWRLLAEVGLPPGMANLVIGQPAPIGRVLCTHPAVRALSFTGSTDVGRILRQQAAPHIKALTLELGGNAPFLVMDDAELEAAADALLANKFRAGGQTCVCTNRVLVHQSAVPRFVALTAERMRALRVGTGTAPDVDIGPLIHRAAWDKVRGHVQDALDHGARRVLGETPPRPDHDWGAWFPPTLLTGVTPAMRLFQEETFGPVVAVGAFDTDEEALHLANATPYGLAAYLFTTHAARADRFIERLRFGHVGLNTATGPAPHAPFGGRKDSGLGREGGTEGLREFIETQVVAESPGPGS
jgi:succinate-semialdehyde dehydrogenase/glutarate-semialdehyde dehydrogenase